MPEDKVQESVFRVIARVLKFLNYDLLTMLSDGRAVLDPNKDWAVVTEAVQELQGFQFLLTDRQNSIVRALSVDIQSDLSQVASFFHDLNARKVKEPEADLLAEINQILDRTRAHVTSHATALKSTFNRDTGLIAPHLAVEGLEAFRRDYPEMSKVGFVMMRFGSTRLHRSILKAVRRALASHQLVALRADDAEYSNDLFGNIRIYLHGCGFGIAIFERIEQEEFNSNVTLEVGYMAALGKPVLLLKDKTLKAMPTDLLGMLYRSFDPLRPAASIPLQIESWLRAKQLIQEGTDPIKPAVQ